MFCGFITGKRYKVTDDLAIKYVSFISEVFVDSGGPWQILNYQPWLIWALPNYVKNKYLKLENVLEKTDEFLDYLRVSVKKF